MKGTLLSCEIESVATRRDNSVVIRVGTPELSAGKAAEILELRNKPAIVYISAKEIPEEEQDLLDDIDPDLPGKTPSQRVRAVQFVLFKQDAEGYADFKSYYAAKMEKIIDHLKTKIK